MDGTSNAIEPEYWGGGGGIVVKTSVLISSEHGLERVLSGPEVFIWRSLLHVTCTESPNSAGCCATSNGKSASISKGATLCPRGI